MKNAYVVSVVDDAESVRKALHVATFALALAAYNAGAEAADRHGGVR
jgi:hypothetical protein